MTGQHHPEISPGTLIASRIADLGWTVTATAWVLGMRREQLQQILSGSCRVTAKSARRIEAALGLPARDLLQRQMQQQLAETPEPDPDIARRRRELEQRIADTRPGRDDVSLTPLELQKMRHAVGWPHRHRNHYCTTAGAPDDELWQRLVGRGLARAGEPAGRDRRFYHLTDEGAAAIAAYDEVP